MVLTGGADKKTHLLHVATGQTMTLGAHDAPIRSVRFVDLGSSSSGAPIVASASWDRTVRFWDARQPSAVTAAATLVCADRVYAMDARGGLLVVATASADRAVHLVDLRNPAVFARTTASPLRHQTRAVAVFPDGRGWATTSIEGRCGMSSADEKDATGYVFFSCVFLSLRPSLQVYIVYIWVYIYVYTYLWRDGV
jgi:mRNA export factor